MSIYTIVELQQRSKLLQLLQDYTTIRMVSGADIWPATEIASVKRDAIIVATKKGLMIRFPLDGSKQNGSRMSPREFLMEVKLKFPLHVIAEKPKEEQVEIQWLKRNIKQ